MGFLTNAVAAAMGVRVSTLNAPGSGYAPYAVLGLKSSSTNEMVLARAETVVVRSEQSDHPDTKKDCGRVIAALLAAVEETLARGDGIELRRFGTFKVRHRRARKARNPRTGEPVEVPAYDVPVFKPSRSLRSRIN